MYCKRTELHIGVVQVPGVRALQQFRVDDAGVGLQSDVFPQVIKVNARNDGPLLGN